jgi:3-hydroxypropanoate dehydrogenase
MDDAPPLDLHYGFPTQLEALDARGREQLFSGARTVNAFDDRPVTDEQLREIFELVHWAPTAANSNPLRILLVRSDEGNARLLPHMNDSNRAKTGSAPVTAVLCVDLDFHEQTPRLLPYRPELKDTFAADAVQREKVARFNATLQAGYFILAVRAVGLAAGPMAGFDGAGIDAEFLADTSWRSILVVNIGHPGPEPWFGRLPRLDYEDVIREI